jgi:hypothetical protein
MNQENHMKQPSADRTSVRVSGHRAKFFKSGVNFAYWRCKCSCGWKFGGWTHHKAEAHRAHRAHQLRSVSSSVPSPKE